VTRAISRLPEPARQVLQSLDDGDMTEEEVERIMRIVGRSLIVAHRKVLMSRYSGNFPVSDQDHLTEDDICMIAVQACR